MPSNASDEALADAVIQNVEFGAYPDSEDVISADLPASALPRLLDTIQKAREEVTGEIRALSRGAAPDVDSWIAQAKQLQADIERSKATAREIVKEAEAGKTLQAVADDASKTHQLLQSELAFNESLAETLVRMKSAADILDGAEALSQDGHIVEALDQFEEAVEAAKDMSRFENARFPGILHERVAQIGADMARKTRDYWDQLVVEDTTRKGFTINPKTKDNSIQMSMVVEALSRLNALCDTVAAFCKKFDNFVVRPLLVKQGRISTMELVVSGPDIHISSLEKSSQQTTTDEIRDVKALITYLADSFPSPVNAVISDILGKSIIEKLIANWLVKSVPIMLEDTVPFQATLDEVSLLSETLDRLHWSGSEELSDWIEEAPRIWLSKRKEAALASIRSASFKGLGSKKVVERVETQKVAKNEPLAAPVQQTDTSHGEEGNDWDAAWEEEEDKSTAEDVAGSEGDDDASAWDVDDGGDANEPSTEQSAEQPASAADEGEAWGWGDDEAEHTKDDAPAEAPKINGEQDPLSHSDQELTLRETYTVTAIPDSLLQLIPQTVLDAEELSSPAYSSSSIATAAIGLYSIPSLLLALYRATAATYYAKDIAGNMLIYNDCSRLSDELHDFLSRQAEKDSHSTLPSAKRASTRLRLDGDLKLLEGFGKRAYGREMEAQRTILRDLLDGAQGFSSCTVQPYASECDNAIAMTVDRVRDVNNQWRDVLSLSARLQSLGNLVSTVANKIIVDVEDMSDISEEESKRLRYFFDQIGKLNDLFVQDAPDGGGEQVDMTGIYTPNWFKFQYLGEIVESSLADIKYLWQEGELSLEFEAEEVVDLIEALFAESDYRRNAIAEIRRSGRHR